MALACVGLTVTFGYAEDAGKGEGRFTIYPVEIDQKMTLVLLDTKTGKIWMYQKELSGTTSAVDQRFKGVTVEGLAYSLGDSKRIELLISDLQAKYLIEKDIKGFLEAMNSEFSYVPDVQKIKALNYNLKLEQGSKE